MRFLDWFIDIQYYCANASKERAQGISTRYLSIKLHIRDETGLYPDYQKFGMFGRRPKGEAECPAYTFGRWYSFINIDGGIGAAKTPPCIFFATSLDGCFGSLKFEPIITCFEGVSKPGGMVEMVEAWCIACMFRCVYTLVRPSTALCLDVLDYSKKGVNLKISLSAALTVPVLVQQR